MLAAEIAGERTLRPATSTLRNRRYRGNRSFQPHIAEELVDRAGFR